MTITTFAYLCMVAVAFGLYYLLPKSWQWLELLAVSLFFYACAATGYTFIFILISVAVTYGATMLHAYGTESDVSDGRSGGLILTRLVSTIGIAAVIINSALWLALKGNALWSPFCRLLGMAIPSLQHVTALPIAAAMGMGYYTVQLIGYQLDCYWGSITPQRNPLKLLLFACFFPQMTMGPISRYSQLEHMFDRHRLSYENLAQGSQRILWGFFKKLVISERLGIIVNVIWSDFDRYPGTYLWIAMLLFPLQLYTDFSGAMDIVLGTAQLFDIHMPENFRQPFFAKTAQEFWQRWHITLGTWSKDYVLYPLLKSTPMVKLSKLCRQRFGKKTGKFLVTATGMFVSWMVLGFWHGAYKYMIGVSLWYWGIMMLGEYLTPTFARMKTALHIQADAHWWQVFVMLRTYVIFSVGAVFFRADDISQAGRFFAGLFHFVSQAATGVWQCCDTIAFDSGLTSKDYSLIVGSLVLLWIVSVVKEKHGEARAWFSHKPFVLRIVFWTALFACVVLYGRYGLMYSSANFLYEIF